MGQTQHKPIGRKTYIDPATGQEKKGAVVPLAQIRADEIWAKVKPYMPQFRVWGNRLLLAVYKRPEITEGGIILTDNYREEDIWQGTVGLVLQVGPRCFIDTDKWKFGGQKAEPGDWVHFRPEHTNLTKIGGQFDGIECRLIQDCYILAGVDGPHVVY